jgi:hypothetical protein
MSSLRRRLIAHLFLCALSSVLDLACAQTPVRFAFLLLSLTALHSTPLSFSKTASFVSHPGTAFNSWSRFSSISDTSSNSSIAPSRRWLSAALYDPSTASLVVRGGGASHSARRSLHCTFLILTACTLFILICQISSVPSSWSAAHDAARYRHVDVPFQAAQDWLGAGPNREPATVSDNWYKDVHVAADIF